MSNLTRKKYWRFFYGKNYFENYGFVIVQINLRDGNFVI